MKQKIDEFLAGDEKLQQFLTWVDEKSKSIEASYKPAAVRAYYLELAHRFFLALDKGEELFFDFSIWYFPLASGIDKHLEYVLSRPFEEDYANDLYSDLQELKNDYDYDIKYDIKNNTVQLR